MKTILLVGPYTQDNIGDVAGFTSLMNILSDALGPVEFVALARHPSDDFDRTYNLKTIKNLDHQTKAESYDRFLNGFNYGDETSHLVEIRKAVESCSLIMIGPGSDLHDAGSSYGLSRNVAPSLFRGVMSYYSIITTLAKFLNKPVIIYSETLIPLKTPVGVELLRLLVENVNYLLLREESSLQVLMENNINVANARLIGDVAFGTKCQDNIEPSNKVLKSQGIPSDLPLTIVAARADYLTWSKEAFDKYVSTMGNVVRALLEERDGIIVFLPHVTYDINTPYQDDRFVAKRILETLSSDLSSRVYSIQKKLTLPEATSIYKKSSLLVSSRRHAIVIAATQKTPIISVSLSANTDFIMHKLGLEEYLFSSESLNISEFRRAVSRCKEAKEEIITAIGHKVAFERERILEYGKVAKYLIETYERHAV